MKTPNSKKTLKHSVLSFAILSLFIFFGLGSSDLFGLLGIPLHSTSIYNEETGEHTNSTIGYKDTSRHSLLWVNNVTGKINDKRQWHGPVEIRNRNTRDYLGGDDDRRSVEYVNMINGDRHGMSTTYNYEKNYQTEKEELVSIDTLCYDHSVAIPCNTLKNSFLKKSFDSNGFQILEHNYPWFLGTLKVIGFDNDYVQAYMDTVELILNAKNFNPSKFNNEYDDVVEILEETPYDSIIQANKIVTSVYGLELLKDFDFRMAVIDQQRQKNSQTYAILQNSYPHYLESFQAVWPDINETDFEIFCQQFDSIMTTYLKLDIEDPFFVDSVDIRINYTVSVIYNSEKSASTTNLLKSAYIDGKKFTPTRIIEEIYKALLGSQTVTTPKQIAGYIRSLMLSKLFFYGDIPRQVFWKAYHMQQNIAQLPTLTTNFLSNPSPTSASVKGNIIDDGGEPITNNGIVWATFLNPNIDDNVATPQTGGDFQVNISGLTEGETYYARSYATNSAGTAYGNNISFIARNTVGVNDDKRNKFDVNIYPNPASEAITISFNVNIYDNFFITISNINGQIITKKGLGILQEGRNQISLDISNIENGIYNCTLTKNNQVKSTNKLLIMR